MIGSVSGLVVMLYSVVAGNDGCRCRCRWMKGVCVGGMFKQMFVNQSRRINAMFTAAPLMPCNEPYPLRPFEASTKE